MLKFGLTVAFIGMGVVFIELIFLVYVIRFITFITGKIEVKKTPVTVKSSKQEETMQAAAEVAVDDEEVIAVISAAVAYLTQGSASIKTIRRLPGVAAPAWSAAGRMEVMNCRQL